VRDPTIFPPLPNSSDSSKNFDSGQRERESERDPSSSPHTQFFRLQRISILASERDTHTETETEMGLWERERD
jgi:hypothetical protein